MLNLIRVFSSVAACAHPIRHLARYGAVLLSLTLIGCRPLVTPAPLRSLPPAVEPAECPFALPGEIEGREYACGILRVPQLREEPEGIQLGIFFARLNAVDPDAAAPPLLFLAGGPGASGVYDAPLLAPTLAPLRAQRDLLFFDIRGAGFSQPRIDCRAFAEGGVGPACMTALRRQGIEPMAFNTTQAAADAAELVAALGYDQADLLAVSYGTRLALEMLRTHPQVVRAAVLDSTVAPETLTQELQAIGDYQAKLWPFAQCEEDATCRGRFGAIAGRFLALLNRLDENGASAIDPAMPSAAALYNLTTLAVGRPDLMALLPLIVDELDRGESATYRALVDGEFATPLPARPPVYAFERFIPLFDSFLQSLTVEQAQVVRRDLAALAGEDDSAAALLAFLDARTPATVAGELRVIAQGMTSYERSRLFAAYGADIPIYDHLSLGDVKTIFNCQEETPFVDPEVLRKNQAVIPLPSLLPPYDFAASVRADQRACLEMGIQPAPASFKDSIPAEQPVLLLSGAQDTVTPTLWAELAAESLPNAAIIRFPAYGHALLYHAGECVAQLAAGFFDDPTRPVDLSCVPVVDYALEQPPLVALTGRMWRLQGWAGEAAEGPPITALFSGGRVIGLDGCGAYTGDFSLVDDRLTVTRLESLQDQCGERELALQQAFLASLGDARSISLRGGRLMLTTTAGELLIFALESDLPLEGPVWTLIAVASGGDGSLTPVLPGAPVSARFDAGAVMGALGCNLYEAMYTLTDGLAVTELQRIGDATCDEPAGVMAQEEAVLALLASATRYRIVGRELFLHDQTTAPLLVFHANP